MESVSQASDKQIAEETVPGKPMSVFLAEPPKVHRYMHTTFSGFISIYTYLLCNTPTSLHTPQTTQPPLPTLLHTLQLPLTQSPPTSNLPPPTHPTASTIHPIPSLCWMSPLFPPSQTIFTTQAHNCQVGSPHFSVHLPVYEGDSVERLVARLKRAANVTGEATEEALQVYQSGGWVG